MDKVELKNILSASFDSERWQRVLREIFGVNKLHQKPFPISLPTNNKTESAFELGSINTADERVVGIYLVNVLPSVWLEKNRVGLRQLLRNIYKYDVDGALIVFTQESQWRFSYVSQVRTEKGRLETEPKRFTYLFGPSESTRTAVDRFFKLKGKPIYLNDLYDAFSVDKLNKDFFKAYKDHYEKFWKYLASIKEYREFLIDKKQTDLEKQEKPIRDFAKKLLGRIVFLQFLQKKGWMGVAINTKTWQNGDKRFIQTLFNYAKDKSVFHSTYLKALFFETLNTKRPNDTAPKILGADIKIPYLNGGLFDKDVSYGHKIDFPEDYFFSLIDFFEQYNFTIDENDPYESEVGIDPEMLGHIFENLLEENREKGAFYTPKEIVHYMCQESLIEYLKSSLPEPDHSFVEQLVRNNQMALVFTNRGKAIRINELLQEIKICDPAIGSGAFPMGLLKEIFECRRLIYPYLKTNVPFDPTQIKKEIIQNNIYGVDIDPGAVDIARLRFWLALVVDELEPHALPNLDYKIMQGNSLLESYEDIDLSKVASLDEPTVRVVNPQVNIFTGRVEDPQMQYSFSTESKKSIKKLIDQYFSEEDKEEKLHIHKAIDTIVLEHIDKSLEGYENQLLIEIATLEKQLKIKTENLNTEQTKDYLFKSKEIKEIEKRKQILSNKGAARQQLIEFENTSARPYFLWHLFFMDVFKEGGFHIMIGNPPYIQMQKDAGTLSDQLVNAGYETYERTGDIYALFYELGFNKLRENGTLTFITSSQWLRANYGKSLRRYFLKKNLLKLLTLGPSVFESAVVDTNILVANKRV
jgi:Eco57I restriction-modification methylase